MKRLLAVLLLLTVPASAEDRAQVDLYLKAEADKDYRSYQSWKRDQARVESWERRDRRPSRGNCRGFYPVEGKKMLLDGLARREARLAWERVVRSREAEEFADAENAVPPPSRSIKCWNVGSFRRCKMEAKACRV